VFVILFVFLQKKKKKSSPTLRRCPGWAQASGIFSIFWIKMIKNTGVSIWIVIQASKPNVLEPLCPGIFFGLGQENKEYAPSLTSHFLKKNNKGL
jgi:hypothetical protein